MQENSSAKKYSVRELSQLKADINNFIEKQNEASRELIFSLRVNTKKIQTAIDLIQEDYSYLSQDESQQLQEYQQKKVDIIKQHGGELDNREDQVIISNYKDIQSEDLLNELDELQDQYSDVITESQKLSTENQKVSNEKIAEIEWKMIPLEKFPESLDASFSENFIEFIEV